MRNPNCETPEDSALMRVPVQAGDVIVLATDGLFDNMNEVGVRVIITMS